MFLTSELVLILEGLLWNKSFLAFRIKLKAFKNAPKCHRLVKHARCMFCNLQIRV